MSDCASVSHREHRGLHREHRDFLCKSGVRFDNFLKSVKSCVSLCPLWFFILCVLCGKANVGKQKTAPLNFCTPPDLQKTAPLNFCTPPDLQKTAPLNFCTPPDLQKTAMLNFCTPPEYMSDRASVSHREHRGLHREHRDFLCKSGVRFDNFLKSVKSCVSLCPLWFFILCVLCGKANVGKQKTAPLNFCTPPDQSRKG